jgi:hypothetical protein
MNFKRNPFHMKHDIQTKFFIVICIFSYCNAVGTIIPFSLNGTWFLSEDLSDPRYDFSGTKQFYVEVVVANATALMDTGGVIDAIFAGSYDLGFASCFCLGFGFSSQRLKAIRGNNNTEVSMQSPTSISFTGIHTFGYGFDGTRMNLYYDNVKIANYSYSGTNIKNLMPLSVGAAYNLGIPSYFASGKYYYLRVNLIFCLTNRSGKMEIITQGI